MMKRSESIQKVIDGMKERMGISDSFVTASDHPYTCRCFRCLSWWLACGPSENSDGSENWGPFSLDEIADAKADCEEYSPRPGDGLYIGDDEDGSPVYVQIEKDVVPMFMGEVDGAEIWC